MYRAAVILFAAISAGLCGFAIWMQVRALTKWRREDLLDATRIQDWASFGTCVGTITADHYSASKLHEGCTGSGTDDNPSESLQKLRNALAVSVHGLYYAYAEGGIKDHNMRHVLSSVLASTINPDMDSVGASINHSAASAAIVAISEVDVPSKSGCDAIYGLSKELLEANADGYGFYHRLLEGNRGDDEESPRNSVPWPMSDISVDCDGNSQTDPDGTQIDPDALNATSIMRLYAHCNAQFQFASSGIDPWKGTFGIPLVGLEPGPGNAWYPFGGIENFNRTRFVDYDTKTRVYLGMRFGYSVWAYVPMLLCSCYLAADALMLFLAEITLPSVLLDMGRISSDDAQMSRNSLVMFATSKNSRYIRFGLACVALFSSVAFWLAFSAVPWGFVYRTMPRPVCEPGDPDHFEPLETNFGFQGSRGGWKADWDATFYELAILTIQVFVVFFEGVVTNPACKTCNDLGSNSKDGKTVKQADPGDGGFVTSSKRFQRMARSFLGFIFVGAIIMIAGQAVSGASFGRIWAEGIVGTRMTTDDTTGVQTPLFNPVTLSEQVYDQTVATLVVTLVAGLVVGVAVQRHLINGIGRWTATLFFAWVGLVVAPFFLLIIYAGVRPIMNQDDANKDCQVLEDAGEDVAKVACDARWWSLLAGGGTLALVLLVMTSLGFYNASTSICEIPNKARVKLTNSLPWNSAFLAGRLARTTNEPAGERLLGNGSDSEKFFKFETAVASSDTLLYAPRIALRA